MLVSLSANCLLWCVSFLVVFSFSYLGLAEVLGHNVCAHFAPFDQVSSVLCVPTHGARSVALVEAAADVLGCELEVAVFAHAEDLRGSHCCGGRRGAGR